MKRPPACLRLIRFSGYIYIYIYAYVYIYMYIHVYIYMGVIGCLWGCRVPALVEG